MRLEDCRITVLATGKVVALTPGGAFPMGNISPSEHCIYENCRAQNLCRMHCCVGKNLRNYGYRIEDGALVKWDTATRS